MENSTPLPDTIKVEEEIPVKQEQTGTILRDEFGRFPKGVSGNPNGRPRRKSLEELVSDELKKQLPNGMLQEENLARMIVGMMFGNVMINGKQVHIEPKIDLIKEYWHYRDGMPKQKTELSGPEGGPIPILAGTTKNVHQNNSNGEDSQSP